MRLYPSELKYNSRMRAPLTSHNLSDQVRGICGQSKPTCNSLHKMVANI